MKTSKVEQSAEMVDKQWHEDHLPNTDLPGVGHCIDCNWWWPYPPAKLEVGFRGHRCCGTPGDRDTNANMSCGQWKLREGLTGFLPLDDWWLP